MTVKNTKPQKKSVAEFQNFSNKGIPPIALFEVAQILFIYGRSSQEFKEAAERRAKEQEGKKFWR